MTAPWFRRYASFSYQPTTWQGRTVIAVMAVTLVACGAFWISLIDTQPTLAWTIAAIGLLAAVAGHAVVLWKMDWDYTNR